MVCSFLGMVASKGTRRVEGNRESTGLKGTRCLSLSGLLVAPNSFLGLSGFSCGAACSTVVRDFLVSSGTNWCVLSCAC